MQQHASCADPPAYIDAALRTWYATKAGQQLLTGIKAHLDGILPGLFGYHAVQVGHVAPAFDLAASSLIRHWVRMGALTQDIQLGGLASALPFAQDSLDLIILLHSLDFSPNPQLILREVERTLIPEGHVIIIGFNPVSLYGLWRLLRRGHHQVPWCGHFYTTLKLKDWLLLVGLAPKACEYVSLAPPLRRERLLRRVMAMEKWGAQALPYAGNLHILIAQKQVVKLTPLRPRWRPRRLSPGKAAEPST